MQNLHKGGRSSEDNIQRAEVHMAAQGPQKPTEFRHPEMHSEPFLTLKYKNQIYYKLFLKNHHLTWARN